MSDNQNDDRWVAGQQGVPQPKPAQPQPAQQQQQQPQMQPRASSSNPLMAFLKPTAVAQRSGVAVSKVKELFETICSEYKMKTTNTRDIFVCIADESPLKIPAVILYQVDQDYIYIYPFILEACGDPLDPIIETGTNGRQITIDRTTSMYYIGTMDNICRARVQADAVSRGKIKGNGKVLLLSYCVIKNGINLEDKDSLTAFFDSADSAFNAKNLTMMNRPTSDLKAENIASRSIQLVARHRITPGATSRNVFGDYVAQDFRVEMIARTADRNKNQDLHEAGQEVTISAITGYVDFAYHVPTPQQAQQAMQQKANAQSGYFPTVIPAYDPYLVITSATPLGTKTQIGDSILTQCFALASINGLAQNQRWASIFTRTGGDNKKATIGAFGLEHDCHIGAPLNPHVIPVSAGFDGSMNGDLFSPVEVIQNYCYPSMVIAIDIERGGPMAWVQNLFAAAKPGSVEETMILKELDHFSGGLFTDKIWDRRKPIMSYDSVPIHKGYYTAHDDSRRDIRCLGYLEMLMFSNGDKSIMEPYSEGFMPGHGSAETMHNKREIMKSTASNIVFTGIDDRHFFNTEFICALEALFSAVGMQIQLEGITDIHTAVGRNTAFGGQFNTTVQSHGAFYQSFGIQPSSTALPGSGLVNFTAR